MSDLKDLEPLSKRLNAASDELSQTLQLIQDRLNALSIGVEAWVDTPIATSDWRDILDRDDEPTGSRQYTATELGYGRLGDGWALLFRNRRFVQGPDDRNFITTETYVDDPREWPLLRGSRELRVAAVPLIPDLIDAIKTQAGAVIARVEQAKKIADSLK